MLDTSIPVYLPNSKSYRVNLMRPQKWFLSKQQAKLVSVAISLFQAFTELVWALREKRRVKNRGEARRVKAKELAGLLSCFFARVSLNELKQFKIKGTMIAICKIIIGKLASDALTVLHFKTNLRQSPYVKLKDLHGMSSLVLNNCRMVRISLAWGNCTGPK